MTGVDIDSRSQLLTELPTTFSHKEAPVFRASRVLPRVCGRFEMRHSPFGVALTENAVRAAHIRSSQAEIVESARARAVWKFLCLPFLLICGRTLTC